MMDYEKLEKDLTRDEDRRALPYSDSRGILTIGIGHNLQKPLPNEVIDLLYQYDVGDVVQALDRALPWWVVLSEPRQRVLANMCFNMGIVRLLGFHHMLDAAKAGNYETAAAEMKNSDWFKQVGPRAVRLQETMRTGV